MYLYRRRGRRLRVERALRVSTALRANLTGELPGRSAHPDTTPQIITYSYPTRYTPGAVGLTGDQSGTATHAPVERVVDRLVATP